jgi:hypothetical protein
MPLFKKSKTDADHDGMTAVKGPDVSILNIQKAFDTRSERRQAEHLRVIYSMGESTGEVRASITWEALAQLRQEMERSGKSISERGVLDFVLVPWIMEQLRRSHGAMESPPEDGYQLDFGPAPKPTEVHKTLVRYGLLAS